MQQIRSDKRYYASCSTTQVNEPESSTFSWHKLDPLLAFHREVLTVQHWTRLRRDFLQVLEKASVNTYHNHTTNNNNTTNGNSTNNNINMTEGLHWNEPRKLWRHSQEILGKWVLSQIARVPAEVIEPLLVWHQEITHKEHTTSETDNKNSEEELEEEQQQGKERLSNYYSSTSPLQKSTEPLYALGMLFFLRDDVLSRLPHQTTYDEQLIRDLSLKSNASTNVHAMQILQRTIASFDLKTKCKVVYEEIEQTMVQVNINNMCKPILRRIEGNDNQRSIAQQRIAGAIAEFSVQFPSTWPAYKKKDCTSVSIPWAAYTRLVRCYTAFTHQSDAFYIREHHLHSEHEPLRVQGTSTPSSLSLHSSTLESSFSESSLRSQELELMMLCRIATVVLRYESNLATGSLQLSADNMLKRYLQKNGYVVMDLCASPINAYMRLAHSKLSQEQEEQQQYVSIDNNELEFEEEEEHGKVHCKKDDANNNNNTVIKEDQEDNECKRGNCKDEVEEVPQFYCSAFADTDVYFGSLGSALHITPESLYYNTQLNPLQQPLLLTLDVPYDEDLCELLFQKLVRDMKRATLSSHVMKSAVNCADMKKRKPMRVDYVLVLPLWWNIALPTRKRLFISNHDECQHKQDNHSCSDNNGKEEEEEEELLTRLITEKSATLHEGYVIKYSWPEALADAVQFTCNDITASNESRNTHNTDKNNDNRNNCNDGAESCNTQSWVCFDGVFVGESYTYFSTATNKKVSGVTTTEVIALGQPRDGTGHTNDKHQLRQAMNSFYGVEENDAYSKPHEADSNL